MFTNQYSFGVLYILEPLIFFFFLLSGRPYAYIRQTDHGVFDHLPHSTTVHQGTHYIHTPRVDTLHIFNRVLSRLFLNFIRLWNYICNTQRVPTQFHATRFEIFLKTLFYSELSTFDNVLHIEQKKKIKEISLKIFFFVPFRINEINS